MKTYMMYSYDKKSGKKYYDRHLLERFRDCETKDEIETMASRIVYLFFRNLGSCVTDHAWDHAIKIRNRTNDEHDLSYFYTKKTMLNAIRDCISYNSQDLIEFLQTDYMKCTIECRTSLSVGLLYPKGTGFNNPKRCYGIRVIVTKDNFNPMRLCVTTAYALL